ncbi:MAG: PepSY domain-containing protein [Flavobacteriaceae bacterium]|nr:PepSY domain-containing protein [Flavobacteriaceae bacterium]
MTNKNYNIYFHLHTVSGIVISVALYIIFLAGAFTLFYDSIDKWESQENNQHISSELIKSGSLNLNKIIDITKGETGDLYSRNLRIVLPSEGENDIMVSVSRPKDSLVNKDLQKSHRFYINKNTSKIVPIKSQYNFADFIYRLHFFSQIPSIGIYIAGLVAFFFMLAIITGVLIHWKKIVSNFFTFRPKAKLKMLFADAHTALGVVGLPFQFAYAITSIYLALSTMALIPAAYLYDGDTTKLIGDLLPDRIEYAMGDKIDETTIEFDKYIKTTKDKWEGFKIDRIYLKNYSTDNAKIQIEGSVDNGLTSDAFVSYDISTSNIDYSNDPYNYSYAERITKSIGIFHYAQYGGFLTKSIYFLLAIITCFVIISGVLIWMQARNKKNIPIKQRIYNLNVSHIYLAICLSMYPIIAMSFNFSKLLPSSFNQSRKLYLYLFFFLGWLALTLLFRYKRDNYYTNKYTLILGSIFGFFIPITNGFVSGNWLWYTVTWEEPDVFVIDIMWIIIASTTLMIALKMKNKPDINLYNQLKTSLYEESNHSK